MILFFYGSNTYTLRQKLRDMISTYLSKTGSDLGLERIEGANVTADRIRAALQASPFLASSRLVIIEGLGKNKTVASKIDHLLALIPDTTVAVFVETEIDQRTVYFKSLSAKAKVATFDPLIPARLAAWAKAEVERLGGTIERPVLTLLLELTAGDQWRLSEEIQKLVNYNAAVTRESVLLLVEAGLDQNIFDLTEAMTGGRPDDALKTFHKLIHAREDVFKILSMVQWQLRNLLLAKAGGQMSQADLAKVGGMSPYVAGKMQTAARRHELEALKTAFIEAVDTEYLIKTGALPSELAVEQLIFRVSNETLQRRSA